jgi:hypothetical protein
MRGEVAQPLVMARYVLPLALTVAAVAFVGVSVASDMMDELAPKVERSSAVAAVRDVCFGPASHRAILREARRSAGETLRGEAVPAIVSGNGAIDWQVVRQVDLGGRQAFIAAGDLSGTSMCRIYFQQDDAEVMARALPGQIVLGAPLGRPDDQGTLNQPAGWPFVAWHVSRKDGWSAIAYAHDPRSAWRSVEVPRGG